MQHDHAIIWRSGISVQPTLEIFSLFFARFVFLQLVSICLCRRWWMCLLLFALVFLLLSLYPENRIYGIHSCGISAAASIIVSNCVFALENWLPTIFDIGTVECKWIVLFQLMICGEVEIEMNFVHSKWNGNFWSQHGTAGLFVLCGLAVIKLNSNNFGRGW